MTFDLRENDYKEPPRDYLGMELFRQMTARVNEGSTEGVNLMYLRKERDPVSLE